MFLALCPWAELWARDVYVSPKGSDTNPGTKAKPVATLEAARDLVRKQKATQPLPRGGLTVWIAAGQYHLARSLVLDESDAGSAAAPIVWRAMKGAQVNITGGQSIAPASFTRVTDEQVLRRLPREAAAHVQQADLAALGIRDYGKHQQYGHAISVCPAPLELFFNAAPMTLARYPNEGGIANGKVIDTGSVPRYGDYGGRGATFEYTDPRHAAWQGVVDIWLQGTFNYGFADDYLPVESINAQTKQVKLALPHLYGVAAGRPYQSYVAYNILEELDRPGEWYLNRATGILYFWPPQSLHDSSILVSILEEPIICLEGASHVTLRDLTVEVGRGIGIYLERGSNNMIEGCTVRNVGTSGIFMGQGAAQTFPHITVDDYTGVPVSRQVGNLQGHIYKHTAWERQAGSHHGVLSCDVYNTGSGGIYLSGGSKRDLIPGHNSVENCVVHDYNRRNKFLWSGINIDGCGNRIAHCEIYNSDWQGIYVHGNDHVFEFNEIHHVTLNSNDTSPWYLGRDPSDRGNVVRYNYFHHCGNAQRMNMGIYCDDSTTGVLVHGNVFYRMKTTHGVLFSNSGWDLLMTNNIVVEPHSHTAVMSAHYYTWAQARGRRCLASRDCCGSVS
ncbi:MAG: right-handed parallel beta-helix repeat-containing protein [Verrucomicrobiota bacterium]